jgi:hypothetical protein
MTVKWTRADIIRAVQKELEGEPEERSAPPETAGTDSKSPEGLMPS